MRYMLDQNTKKTDTMRYNKHDPIIHLPTTQEIFYCLSSAKEWCRILSQTYGDKPYRDFLIWLIDRDFYEPDPKRITVDRMSKDYSSSSRKIKTWIEQIYDDIFALNEASPHLFRKDGLKISIYFKNFDSFAGLDISVQCIPREHERISFPFVLAKMGTDTFYVDMVRHEFGSATTIEIWLKGGFENKYREFILEKAAFQRRIGWEDLLHQRPYEIDDRLRKIYRD